MVWTKILPCPFCGNSDHRVGVRKIKDKGYKVVCGNCGASGSYSAIKEWHEGKCIAQREAIKGWNMRSDNK